MTSGRFYLSRDFLATTVPPWYVFDLFVACDSLQVVLNVRNTKKFVMAILHRSVM